MTEYEAYQEHIRYTHDTYCRIVIRHASFDAARMLAARWKREISLEYLTEEKFVPLSTIHLSVLTLSRFAKNGRKKSSKSFSDLLLPVPLWGGGIFSCK